ncbi:MAG: hypothetical protein A2X35_09490 [Elusimicrobia bacterium GWA2_61_42]|nr:MAG: hypothetical protein A2X35_09490 [Elusimicrobia bacterium GWA2_61_42]OGR74922.1 MAG: hypothetical protein A2X38_05700 [Elusimicrobia bacterium GWC2_61_25]
MFTTRILVSVFEFLLSVVMSGFIIYLTYRVFIKANPDFNMEEEIKKGNVAVGILVATILLAASMILQKGLGSVVSIFRLYVSAPGEGGIALWKLALISAGHLGLSMLLAVITISVTLRLFGKLVRSHMNAGAELQKGNLAVGIVLSAVVLVAALYVGEGVSSISKALVPQPSIGQIEIMQ